MICCWISWCFFWQYPILQVCILGMRSLYYTFIWFVPCFYCPYAFTYTAVGWWKCRFSNTTGETIGANLIDHLFFVVVLLWFYFAFIFVCLYRIIVAKSLFTCVLLFSFFCLSFDLRLRITPLVSSNFYFTHHVFL